MASNIHNMKKSNYYTKLEGDVKERYDEKIKKCFGIDPYTINIKDLSLDSKDFPAITSWDIGNYMINSISPYTKRFFDNVKGTEAYSYFESGFVLSVGAKKNNDLVILKGKVKHSQSLNKTPLNVWVLTKMDGEIVCAHCTCLAGLSETCSHVGAICFAVKKIAELPDIKSVTDVLCQWNIPVFKDVAMSAAKNISWRIRSHENTMFKSSFLEHCDSFGHLSDERINDFIAKCHSDGDVTALETILQPLKSRKTNIRDEIYLASIYDDSNRNKTLSELVEMGKSKDLNISSEEANGISSVTLPRLKSKSYIGLKRGRITASNFKSCCTANIECPSVTTIRGVIKPTKNNEVPSIKEKKNVIERYIRMSDSIHEEFGYSETGLIINPKMPYFVGSPDGLITCICHGNGCVATKYLKVMESEGSPEVLTLTPNNILNKRGDNYYLERSHEFFYHVQLEINLSDLKYCDFLIWSRKNALVVKVFADTAFWVESIQKSTKFHEQCIMPELLGKYFTEENANPSSEDFEVIALEIEALGKIDCESDEDGDVLMEELESIDEDVLIDELESSGGDSLSYKISSNLTKESESKKIIAGFRNNVPFSQAGDSNHKNLMNVSIEDLLKTFSTHEAHLKGLYFEQIKQLKRHYRSKDIPYMTALDIVNQKQFEAMVNFSESKLVRNLEEEHNSSDVIFDAIIPEWALSEFCTKFNCTRSEAVVTLKMQSQAQAACYLSDSDEKQF